MVAPVCNIYIAFPGMPNRERQASRWLRRIKKTEGKDTFSREGHGEGICKMLTATYSIHFSTQKHRRHNSRGRPTITFSSKLLFAQPSSDAWGLRLQSISSWSHNNMQSFNLKCHILIMHTSLLQKCHPFLIVNVL